MYEDAAETTELHKAVAEVRKGKLEWLMSLEELGASQGEVAELLLEVLEPGNYQRLVKSYGGSHHSPPLREICQLCVNDRFRAHHRNLAGTLMCLLRDIDKRRYWDRDALIRAIGNISGEEILPDLVYEVGLERGIIEENFGYSSNLRREVEERRDELEGAALRRFDAARVAELRTLIELMDRLSSNRDWGRGTPPARSPTSCSTTSSAAGSVTPTRKWSRWLRAGVACVRSRGTWSQ